jgi:hypothetical protein
MCSCMLAILLAIFLCCATGITFLHLPAKLQVYYKETLGIIKVWVTFF